MRSCAHQPLPFGQIAEFKRFASVSAPTSHDASRSFG